MSIETKTDMSSFGQKQAQAMFKTLAVSSTHGVHGQDFMLTILGKYGNSYYARNKQYCAF